MAHTPSGFATVAILIPNVPDFPRAYYAIIALGGIVVPIHALLKAEEIAFVLEGMRIDLADLSGALLDEGSHFSLVEQTSTLLLGTSDMTSDDVLLGCLPLFHTFGQTCVLNTGIRAGATIVLMPKFDGAGAVELIRQHGRTIFFGVPTMYTVILAATPRAGTIGTPIGGRDHAFGRRLLVPHGQEVVAAVVLIAGATATAPELVAFAKEYSAAHKFPREVTIVDSLPMARAARC